MVTDEWCKHIHQRLLDSDPVAPAELAEKILAPLRKILWKDYANGSNTEILEDAIVDAVISYIKKPQQFNPDKRGLLGYLVMSAKGDLLNKFKSSQRIKEREITFSDFELSEVSGNNKIEEQLTRKRTETLNQDGVIDLEDKIDLHRDILTALESIKILFDNEQDQSAAELILMGERSTSAFAKIFLLEHLDLEVQRRQVKRHKDRIKKRLERWRNEK